MGRGHWSPPNLYVLLPLSTALPHRKDAMSFLSCAAVSFLLLVAPLLSPELSLLVCLPYHTSDVCRMLFPRCPTCCSSTEQPMLPELLFPVMLSSSPIVLLLMSPELLLTSTPICSLLVSWSFHMPSILSSLCCSRTPQMSLGFLCLSVLATHKWCREGWSIQCLLCFRLPKKG